VIVRLDQVRLEPLRWQDSSSIPLESLQREELVGLSPIEWQGSIGFNDPGFLLQGGLSYRQRLVCTRCLTEFEEAVRSELRLLIESGGAAVAPGERELEESELGVVHVEGDELDTAPLFQEQVLLNLPMKPLCRADCKGLCPKCGVDRNARSCDCAVESIDPRWSALAGLKDRWKSEKKGS
jgi:uncharacterized protein